MAHLLVWISHPARCRKAAKWLSSLQYRVAMPLNCLGWAKKFSTRCLERYETASYCRHFFLFDFGGIVVLIPKSERDKRIASVSYALSANTSRVEMPSSRVPSSLHSVAFPGLSTNRVNLPDLSVRAISFVVSPPRLLPMACCMADSTGGRPFLARLPHADGP